MTTHTHSTTTRPNVGAVSLLGIGLVVVAVALMHSVWNVWPAVEEVAARGAADSERAALDAPMANVDAFLLDLDLDLSEGQAYLVLIFVFGMLGSYIHAATSFATYIGNREFRMSWAWWYLLRPFIGGAVALTLVVAILGGVVTLSSSGSTVEPRTLNPYTIAAFAALAGWFSKTTADKLEEVFDTLLKNGQDQHRDDKLRDPAPAVDRVVLVSGPAGTTMTIAGRDLTGDSMVRVDGTPHPARLVPDVGLVVELDALPPGDVEVQVVNAAERTSPPVRVSSAAQRDDAVPADGAQRRWNALVGGVRRLASAVL